MKAAFTQAEETSRGYYAKLDEVLREAIAKEIGEGFDLESLRCRLHCISTPDRVSYFLDETHLATVRKLDLGAIGWQP